MAVWAEGFGGQLVAFPDVDHIPTPIRDEFDEVIPDTHMLIDGVLHLRCGQCRIRPVPHGYSFVQWCDPCLRGETAEGVAAMERIPERNARLRGEVDRS